MIFPLSEVVYRLRHPPHTKKRSITLANVRITLYSAPNCAYCRQAKAFLKKHRVKFMEFDIQRNRRAAKDLQRMGARGVPVILVGQQRLDGFDPKRLTTALRSAGVDV